MAASKVDEVQCVFQKSEEVTHRFIYKKDDFKKENACVRVSFNKIPGLQLAFLLTKKLR